MKYFTNLKKNLYFAVLKKLAAILLLTIFVFNTIGYRLLIAVVQDKVDAAFEGRLDKGIYNDEDLLTVKIPINLPYQNNWKEFERVDGEINLNGQIYKYVKRKIYNDTMILLCIQHETKTKLEQKANDYFGKMNDLPGNDTKKADAYKQLLSDYDTVADSPAFSIAGKTSEFNVQNETFLLKQFIPLYGQPPEVVA